MYNVTQAYFGDQIAGEASNRIHLKTTYDIINYNDTNNEAKLNPKEGSSKQVKDESAWDAPRLKTINLINYY